MSEPAVSSEAPLKRVSAWIGRSVTLEGDVAIVLAVDDTPHAPSAWVKFSDPPFPPRYASVDLSELIDVDTGVEGPRWGAGGMAADLLQRKAAREAPTTPSAP